MISLFKRLSQKEDPPDSSHELLRVVRLLLQGIGLHAVEGDHQDHEKFRQDMQKLLSALDAAPTTAVLLVTTGSVLKTLEDYNQRASRYVRMQGTELQNMIAMLTRTVATLGAGSDRSVARLRDIEGQIEKTSVIEDVRMLKLRMEECLESIRDEAQRQKTESAMALEGLRQEIVHSQQRMRAGTAAPARDPVTGLPIRAEAQAAFEALFESGTPAYAALFVVGRVALINSRFGYAVGDRVLNLYLEELQKQLSAADTIYRWNGPAFMAILHRPDRLEKVREQLSFIIPSKLERTIQLPNRTALLPISATWTVFPIIPPIHDLLNQLDNFLSSQWQQSEQ